MYSCVCGAFITILYKNGLFSQENLQCQREEENEQNHYVVVVVKRTAGYTENQGSWPQVNQQHVYFFSKVHGNIEFTITGARPYSSDSSQDGLEVFCILCFSW